MWNPAPNSHETAHMHKLGSHASDAIVVSMREPVPMPMSANSVSMAERFSTPHTMTVISPMTRYTPIMMTPTIRPVLIVRRTPSDT